MFWRISQREQFIFIACLVLTFGFIGYRGIYIPLQEKADELDNRIIVTQKKIRRSQSTIQNAEAIDVRYKQYLQQFRQDAEAEQIMSSVIAQIEQIASDLDIQIADLKPQRVQKIKGVYNEFPVTLRLQSTLPEVTEFLYILQSEPHYFAINDIKFDKSSRRRSSEIKTNLLLSKIYIP